MSLSRNTAEQLLYELKINNLNPKKRQKVLDGLEDHFSRVIFATLLSRATHEQFERIKMALNSDNAEGEIQKISAEIPGLAELLEQRIKQEFEVLKTVMK